MIGRVAVFLVPALATITPRGPHVPRLRPHRPPVVRPRVPEAATDLRPGESLTYRIRLGGMESGRAALAVGKPGKDRRGRTVALRGAVEPLPALRGLLPYRAEMVSYVDQRAGLPRRTVTTRSIREKEKRLEATYRPNGIDVRQDGGRPAKLKRRRGHRTHDALSALWSLRSRARKPGERIHFAVQDGKKTHRVRLVAGKVEALDTPFGEIEAQRFEGNWRAPRKRKPRSFTLWLSADDARVPVRLEGKTRLGVTRFDLVDYTNPDKKPRRARRP